MAYKKNVKEGKKYISFLQNIRQSKDTNLLRQNFKILKNHKDTIYHLSKLKDGRLISSSADKTLKIYTKDTFEVQLSIK